MLNSRRLLSFATIMMLFLIAGHQPSATALGDGSIQGKTSALSGGSVRSEGGVEIIVTLLDGSETTNRFRSKSDGSFEFPLRVGAAANVVFEKRGFRPSLITALIGAPGTNLNVALVQDLAAARAIAKELEGALDVYRKDGVTPER